MFAGLQAIGTHVDPQKSSNPAARKVIMVVKKVVEHINKSPKAKEKVLECCCAGLLLFRG